MAGSAGASFRREGRTDWSRVHGPMAENMAGYFNHYWRSDLFVPAVRNARPGEIVHLLKTFDRDVLLAN